MNCWPIGNCCGTEKDLRQLILCDKLERCNIRFIALPLSSKPRLTLCASSSTTDFRARLISNRFCAENCLVRYEIRQNSLASGSILKCTHWCGHQAPTSIQLSCTIGRNTKLRLRKQPHVGKKSSRRPQLVRQTYKQPSSKGSGCFASKILLSVSVRLGHTSEVSRILPEKLP